MNGIARRQWLPVQSPEDHRSRGRYDNTALRRRNNAVRGVAVTIHYGVGRPSSRLRLIGGARCGSAAARRRSDENRCRASSGRCRVGPEAARRVLAAILYLLVTGTCTCQFCDDRDATVCDVVVGATCYLLSSSTSSLILNLLHSTGSV